MPSIDRKGVPIHFEDMGSGPPVVMGHSILCSGEMWVNQVLRLAERYRVINIDQRGHGRSVPATSPYELCGMVEDAFAVIDRLEIDHAIWAGLSMSGMVAMHAAIAAPDRVAALLLLDTHAGEEDASLPPALSREIADALPNSSLVVIPEAGHLSALENPDAATESMLGFLDSLN